VSFAEGDVVNAAGALSFTGAATEDVVVVLVSPSGVASRVDEPPGCNRTLSVIRKPARWLSRDACCRRGRSRSASPVSEAIEKWPSKGDQPCSGDRRPLDVTPAVRILI
jgi:hypothetical protein